MKPTVIVWDLETVPDLAGFAAANDLEAIEGELHPKASLVVVKLRRGISNPSIS
jgi:hypothetical protein